jgi:hypothetical protein
MPSGTHTDSCQIGGAVNSRTVSKTADNANTYGDATVPIVLTAGISTGATWVKNTDTTAHGTATGANAAGWGASATVDVYGTDGTLYAYGVTATMTTDAFALASGTEVAAYPANGTAIILAKQVNVNLTIDGDNAEMVSVKADVLCHAGFHDVSSNLIRSLLLQADEPDNWDSDEVVNPYTGAVITHVHISNGTTTAGTFTCSVLQDSTP